MIRRCGATVSFVAQGSTTKETTANSDRENGGWVVPVPFSSFAMEHHGPTRPSRGPWPHSAARAGSWAVSSLITRPWHSEIVKSKVTWTAQRCKAVLAIHRMCMPGKPKLDALLGCWPLSLHSKQANTALVVFADNCLWMLTGEGTFGSNALCRQILIHVLFDSNDAAHTSYSSNGHAWHTRTWKAACMDTQEPRPVRNQVQEHPNILF